MKPRTTYLVAVSLWFMAGGLALVVAESLAAVLLLLALMVALTVRVERIRCPACRNKVWEEGKYFDRYVFPKVCPRCMSDLG